MNSNYKLARRNLIYQRIQNYMQQVIPTSYKLTQVFNNHPESYEFEFHFNTRTNDENVFRLIFSGSIFNTVTHLKFNFEKQISPTRILTLQSFIKRFNDVTDFDFLNFAYDVDMLVKNTKNLSETKK